VLTKTGTSEHAVQCEVARAESIPNIALLAGSSPRKPEHLGHGKAGAARTRDWGAVDKSNLVL
jgi:hypothetical protein